MYLDVCVHTPKRGSGVASPLPPCGSLGSNSSLQAWWRVPPTDPSHQLSPFSFEMEPAKVTRLLLNSPSCCLSPLGSGDFSMGHGALGRRSFVLVISSLLSSTLSLLAPSCTQDDQLKPSQLDSSDPVILPLRRWRQEDHNFEANLGYTVRLLEKQKQKNKKAPKLKSVWDLEE